MKKNSWKIIFSSLVVLMPMLAGFILWKDLPEQIPTHWNWQGEADAWSSKLFAVAGMPVFLLAMHLLCLWATSKDERNKTQSKIIFNLTMCIVPAISIFIGVLTYSEISGSVFKPTGILSVLLGILFICIGNYMPKCKPNRTIGIRVKWTLESEENWYATHRLGGRVFMLGGLAVLLTVFLPEAVMSIAFIAVLAVSTAVPIVYSYCFSKKNK